MAGWVRNRPDGAVEAVVEGEAEAVRAMLAFLREGPRGAVVESLDVQDEEPQGESGFRVEG